MWSILLNAHISGAVQNDTDPIHVDLPLGEDGCLQLAKHKIALGQRGIEQMNAIEMYDSDGGLWTSVKWVSSLSVQVGQPFFLKYQCVDPSGFQYYVQ
jgi:hypothetical protein